jgi:hypothetical protein
MLVILKSLHCREPCGGKKGAIGEVTYVHISLGMVQTREKTLNYLIDIPHTLQFVSKRRFSGFLLVEERVGIVGGPRRGRGAGWMRGRVRVFGGPLRRRIPEIFSVSI